MSAPNQGRQSPPPEAQSDKQQAAMSGGPNEQNAHKENDLSQLESNPTGPLDKAAEEKTKKGNGNPDLGGK